MSTGAPHAARLDPTGLFLLLITMTGWGLNWPAMKLLIAVLPPLSIRALGGAMGCAALLAIALARREALSVPRALWGRLVLVSLLNITSWMGLASFSLLWLAASEATIVCYTVAVWAALLAWLVLGERLGVRRIAALLLALGGLGLLVLGQGVEAGIGKLPGVGLALGSAMLFALGTIVTKRWPLGLPPTTSVVWQVGIGVLPLAVGAMLFDDPQFSVLSVGGWALLAYGGLVGLGVAYLSWFTALRRLPASVASIGTLITPVVGVLGSVFFLGEPFGWREGIALVLTIGGVALALRG